MFGKLPEGKQTSTKTWARLQSMRLDRARSAALSLRPRGQHHEAYSVHGLLLVPRGSWTFLLVSFPLTRPFSNVPAVSAVSQVNVR